MGQPWLFIQFIELREWGVFGFGNPTSGGTVFLNFKNSFPRSPVLMNFVSPCVPFARTCKSSPQLQQFIAGPRVLTI